MPYLTPDAPTGNSGRVLVIPDTYLPVVNGALSELLAGFNWEEYGSDTIEDAIDRMLAMLSDFWVSSVEEFSGMASPIAVPIWTLNVASVNPDWVSNTGVRGAGYYQSGNNTQNGYIEWKVWLSKGSWDWRLMKVKGSNTGIAAITLDGNSVTTTDFYNSSLLEEQTTISLGALDAGAHLLRMTMSTKNGSSSAYGWRLSGSALMKTA